MKISNDNLINRRKTVERANTLFVSYGTNFTFSDVFLVNNDECKMKRTRQKVIKMVRNTLLFVIHNHR